MKTYGKTSISGADSVVYAKIGSHNLRIERRESSLKNDRILQKYHQKIKKKWKKAIEFS